MLKGLTELNSFSNKTALHHVYLNEKGSNLKGYVASFVILLYHAACDKATAITGRLLCCTSVSTSKTRASS